MHLKNYNVTLIETTRRYSTIYWIKAARFLINFYIDECKYLKYDEYANNHADRMMYESWCHGELRITQYGDMMKARIALT